MDIEGIMDRFADNCGWAVHSSKISGAWACSKQKWLLLPADKGLGLCPCKFWVKIYPNKVKKAEIPPKSLF